MDDEETADLNSNETLTSVLLPNPDAHKSRQMLSEFSSDDEDEVEVEKLDEDEDVELDSQPICPMVKTLNSTTSLIETPTKPKEKLAHSNSFPNSRHENFPKNSFDLFLDFSLETTGTKIIFDERKDYFAAKRNFGEKRIEFEEARHYDDLWAFCLKSRTIRFYSLTNFESEKENDPNAVPPSIQIEIEKFFPKNSKFWICFERRPTFVDSTFNCDIDAMKEEFQSVGNRKIVASIDVVKSVNVNFSYGALTSIETFCFHPSFRYENHRESQGKWKIRFRLKQIELIRPEKNERVEEKILKTFHSSILRSDLIDRAAVFTVKSSGFDLFISIKGNLSEYEIKQFVGENHQESERVSLNNDECPTFSTLSLSFHWKKFRQAEGIFQIKRLFKSFLDFFYFNQISVCFGSIETRQGSIVRPPPQSILSRSQIQVYAIIMLRHVGYSVIQKLQENEHFYEYLIESADRDDDKWYRLCLSVVRRASEYRFLNLLHELEKAKNEYRKQLEQCELLGNSMATILSPPRENFAYVPSIRITPTTKQVRPLKLVKKHRLLREQNFNDPLSFALVEIRDEANRGLYARDFGALRKQFYRYLNQKVTIYRLSYEYLHHSMSQVKEKQFWFLESKYSTSDVLSWTGNFDNERIVAKHAARIALGLTSTDPSIRIPAEHVKYIPDVENEKYCFTDGVGTISPKYCKMVQEVFKRRVMPSVLQIRYGGCKGTLSVDPKLDDQKHQLIIRHSMRKFMSDHDQLEICKISSPRPLHLNRQDILLLSNRGVPESHLLVLQNEHHLWLVQALLSSSVAFELLNDRVGSINFNFRDIANTINLVDEPFFLQLLITCGHDCVSKFQKRAKIKIDKNKARNMFGTVDEYGVLEYGQVFVQYSHINDEKLDALDKAPLTPPKVLDNVRVVITKNPCHHPGDLRTFTAVDRPELRHLVDVVVFPQKGHRPHPNEISGSDLDGDEYAVIWDADLVPQTDNFEPFDYDSEAKPVPLDRFVEREDINEIVLDIASQNLTGDMSNLHLALADALDTCHPEVLQLAGYISQELDAPKTGKHPITLEDLNRYRHELLSGGYPDFMMKETVKSYTSKKIIGQLFRSARRAISRWHQAARTHCSLRYLNTIQTEDQSINDSHSSQTINHSTGVSFKQQLSLILDQTIEHPQAQDYAEWARQLFDVYRESLLNIIGVFNYQDEIDLICRCETLDQLSSGKQDLNISAGLELQRLIDTTRYQFFSKFDRLAEDPTAVAPHQGKCTRDRQCSECKEIKLAQAAACYIACYKKAAEQSSKARNRILSFPWLFAPLLTELKRRNQLLNNLAPSSKWIVMGRAMRAMAKRLLDENKFTLKLYCSAYTSTATIFLRPITSAEENPPSLIRRKIVKPDIESPEISLIQVLFIDIMNQWIEQQTIFGTYSPIDKKPLIRQVCWHQLLRNFIYSSTEETNENQEILELPPFEQCKIVFQQRNHELMVQRYTNFVREQISSSSSTFDHLMYDYSIRLIRLCFELAREHQSNEYACLSDYLVLALQSIGIENDLKDIEF